MIVKGRLAAMVHNGMSTALATASSVIAPSTLSDLSLKGPFEVLMLLPNRLFWNFDYAERVGLDV